MFGDLKLSAIVVQWGGEVYSKTLMQRDVNHTSTSMGSGIEAQSYQHAAWIRHVRIIDYSGSGERYPEWVHEYMGSVHHRTGALFWWQGQKISLLPMMRDFFLVLLYQVGVAGIQYLN